MRRTFLIIIVVFVAGLGIRFFARSAYTDMLQRRDARRRHGGDRKIPQEDIEVTLSQDPKGLMDVWSEDGVLLNPGTPAVVGKQAIQANNEKGHAQVPGFKVLSYTPDLKNIHVQIADGWAYEWGETDAKFQLSPDKRHQSACIAKESA